MNTMKKPTAKAMNPNIHPVKLKDTQHTTFFLHYVGQNFEENLAMAPDSTPQVYVLKWDPAIGHYDRSQFELTTSKFKSKDIEKVLNDISTVPGLNPREIWTCKLATLKFFNNSFLTILKLIFCVIAMMKLAAWGLGGDYPQMASWVDTAWIAFGIYGMVLVVAKYITSYLLSRYVLQALNARMGLVAKKLKKWNEAYKPQATWVRGNLAAWIELHLSESAYDIRGYDYPDLPEVDNGNKGYDYPEEPAEDQPKNRFGN
jgi:hypothetical protein